MPWLHLNDYMTPPKLTFEMNGVKDVTIQEEVRSVWHPQCIYVTILQITGYHLKNY